MYIIYEDSSNGELIERDRYNDFDSAFNRVIELVNKKGDIHYLRYSGEKNDMVFDYGSHTEFFRIKEEG